MACFKPLKGYRTPGGKLTFSRKNSTAELAEVACGQCLGCRLDYSQSWAIRCLHEASLHEENCFITLTYEDSQIPANGSLDKTHFRNFMKRLRFEVAPRKVRFYHCGEYGEKFSRPHYHALIFGYDFPDKEWWSYSSQKNRLYKSAQLERLWPFGFNTIGDLTVESAAYVARYSMKKIKGLALSERDPETDLLPYQTIDMYGEIVELEPEYGTMSRRPGIGYEWYEKFKADVFPGDFCVHEGKKVRTPRYYRDLLEREDPDLADYLKQKRIGKAMEHKEDQTRERLEVREICLKARTRNLKRNIENGTQNF